VDWYDRQIIQFVLRWIPFGGPPDDETLPRFGLTPGEFRSRFRDIVSNLTRNEYTLVDDDRELLASTIHAIVSGSRGSERTAICDDWLPQTAWQKFRPQAVN